MRKKNIRHNVNQKCTTQVHENAILLLEGLLFLNNQIIYKLSV